MKPDKSLVHSHYLLFPMAQLSESLTQSPVKEETTSVIVV